MYEHALHPAFTEEVPYVVAGIRLDAGPFMYSNIVGVAAPELGDRVEPVFEDVSPAVTLVRFHLVDANDLLRTDHRETGRIM